MAGNKVEAYGGSISFTLGHSEYNSLGLGAQEDFDLIIESKTLGITLGHKHIVPGELYPVSPPCPARTYVRAREHTEYKDPSTIREGWTGFLGCCYTARE